MQCISLALYLCEHNCQEEEFHHCCHKLHLQHACFARSCNRQLLVNQWIDHCHFFQHQCLPQFLLWSRSLSLGYVTLPCSFFFVLVIDGLAFGSLFPCCKANFKDSHLRFLASLLLKLEIGCKGCDRPSSNIFAASLLLLTTEMDDFEAGNCEPPLGTSNSSSS